MLVVCPVFSGHFKCPCPAAMTRQSFRIRTLEKVKNPLHFRWVLGGSSHLVSGLYNPGYKWDKWG